MLCSLCGEPTKHFWKNEVLEYVQCKNCKAILLLPQYYVSPEAEKERYLEHNNDVSDVRYQNFVEPITSRILEDFEPINAGLDFGCGTGPVAASELEKETYQVALYDPYFHDNTNVLDNTYSFIICCEVMEHFQDPKKEFQKLFSLLKKGGKLYCKTSLYEEKTNFSEWYYKDDPTHVFFYTEKSLKLIKDNFGFTKLEIYPKVIVFSK